MTKYDVKEYLDKIYNLKILNVNLGIVNYIRYRSPLPWKTNGLTEWKFIEPWKIAHVFLVSNYNTLFCRFVFCFSSTFRYKEILF